MAPVSQSHARAEWFGGCHRGAIVRNRAFPNYSFSDADPGEWFANDDILGVRPPAWSLCSIATLPSELLAPESTAVQTFTQKVTVTLNYGQLLYLENALLVAKP
ncbi:MAG: hypothetical protein PUI93_00765 [Ellagibacter isourolithinifaciens]|uniref:hypothetical protein n=1 Tax=Ellagibacter isourolithinifaciens TaxID=2137581 RepID=UPI0023F3D7A2|nr:hypothetical protein [Ellagibacter isourolithinifaciens]MDD7689430.1 hypothetical protein [Ellagibacter isourolithinifaciens]MDY4122673.1 hypothetical protein [Ellagibacter isourolithinifaciens]MDY4989146.1 hypothetical protein [Ellagibacter isourolithinifaciens]